MKVVAIEPDASANGANDDSSCSEDVVGKEEACDGVEGVAEDERSTQDSLSVRVKKERKKE